MNSAVNMSASDDNATDASSKGFAGMLAGYKKYIPGMNSASKSTSSRLTGGYDWSKTVPATNSAEAAPAGQGATGETPPVDNTGTTGGPCGAMVYKDFGPCKKKSDKCVKSPWPFSPGTCETPKKGDKPTIQHTVEAINSAVAAPVAGSVDGPCGVWELGKMDFGECSAGLECSSPKLKLLYGTKTYSLPNVCSNETTASVQVESIADAATTTEDDPDKVAEMAKAVADKADKVAQKAASAAELLAHKLLSAAAELKKSAAQLKEKANQLSTKKSAEPAKNVAMYATSPGSTSGGYSLLSWVFFAGVCGAVAFTWTKFNSNSYQRI